MPVRVAGEVRGYFLFLNPSARIINDVTTPENPEHHDETASENDEFRFDLSASRSRNSHTRLIAAGVALLFIVFIILTMTTDIASRMLPMRDDYLLAMIPVAPDGAEPLALTTLDHEITDKTITMRGSVMNRTDYPISGLLAVIEVVDTTGRFGQTLEVVPDPAELPAHATSAFQTTVTLQEKPAVYSLKFRFADGPFVPHKDDRAATYGITGN